MNSNLNDEIDFIEIIKKLYIKKSIILVFTILSSLIGITYSLIAPIKYDSYTIFIPQNQENTNSSISGVASLVGINLSSQNNGGEIPFSMYPYIGESTRFKRMVLNQLIDSKQNLTIKNYIINTYNLEDEEELNYSNIYVSKIEEKCFKILDEILSINVNQKDGFVTINASTSNAKYSALIANNAKEILQKIIIENKIESARQNLKFSEEQLMIKKKEFEAIQDKLAFYSESNLNSINSYVLNEKERIEAEFQIISAVVTELAKQVEQAKLQVTKDTPVFATIREAVIPNIRTSPVRSKIVIFYTIIGFTISTIYVLLFKSVRNIITRIIN